VAGLAWTVAPWRLAQAGHLHVLSAGGMALALAMLAAGTASGGVAGRARIRPAPPRLGHRRLVGRRLADHHRVQPRPGLRLCPARGTGGRCGGLAGRRRSLPPWRLLLADAVGGLIFTATVLMMAQPYLKVFELYPDQQRSAAWVELYSAPLSGLLTAPHESWLWGGLHTNAADRLSVPGEMTLLPGSPWPPWLWPG